MTDAEKLALALKWLKQLQWSQDGKEDKDTCLACSGVWWRNGHTATCEIGILLVEKKGEAE